MKLVLVLSTVFCAAVAASTAISGASAISGAASAGGWHTNFDIDDGTFLVDDGAVSHCPSCVYESAAHVTFGAPNLQLRLDDAPCVKTPSACCAGGQCADVAAGHLRSAAAQAFGMYTFVARPSFSASGSGGAPPPPNSSFACLTTSYLGAPHHEVASCFIGAQPTEVSLGYWSPGTTADGVVKRVDTGIDLHAAFHTYVVAWTPTALSLSIDGKLIISATAAGPNTTIPWLPGQVLLINRFQGSYAGPALVDVQEALYTPAAALD